MFPLSRIESMPKSFAPLPPVPDHPALERDILALWEDEKTFERLRDRNRGGPTFSFMTGRARRTGRPACSTSVAF